MTQMTPPILPSHRDSELARTLSAKLEQNSEVSLGDLPKPVLALVQQILEEMGQGHAISLSSLPSELTTQEAATALGVSRPFVIKLMAEGELAYRRVGTHRRVRLDEVLAYFERSKVARVDTLGALIADAQELGMGY
jgi:excisionase family DNA binding protein